MKILADKVEERGVEISNGDTYENVLKKLKINPEEVIVLRNGKPVPEDEKLDINKNKEEVDITIIGVVSRG